MRIERLRADHDRAPFDCGEPELDEWLRRYARQNDEHGIGRTFVAVEDGALRVLGYHTLRSGAVAREAFPDASARRLPRYPVPVVHLARLAVDRIARGQRLGERLLIDALERALVVSEVVAVFAVEVQAISDDARAFYLKYGFVPMRDGPRHLYLSMNAIRKALAAP